MGLSAELPSIFHACTYFLQAIGVLLTRESLQPFGHERRRDPAFSVIGSAILEFTSRRDE